VITINRIISDILFLLIPTLAIAFFWLMIRLIEISYEGHSDRIPSWLDGLSDKLPSATGPVGKRWRILAVLLVPVYVIYLVTFDATPPLLRFLIAILALAVFGGCIYYCDKKLGK
jgi:hypothetical protein